jgi:hypothetical protein
MYELVWDLMRDGCRHQWSFLVPGMVSLIAFALSIHGGAVEVAYRRRFRVVAALVGTCFGLGASVIGVTLRSECSMLEHAVAIGNVQVVEGIVQGFAQSGGGRGESFAVGGHTFSYGQYLLDAGYHTTSRYGGAIRAGEYVRICFVGDSIVRVEARRVEARKGTVDQ